MFVESEIMRASTQKAVRVAVQLRVCERRAKGCSRWVLSLSEGDIAVAYAGLKLGF